ncbi:MAG: STAS domain-containing protein [Rhodospirillaceae bacterium]
MSLIKWNEEDGQVKLGLPSDLDLPMAQPLVDSLRHAFAVGDKIDVLAAGVERVSTACVQALLVASRTAAESRQVFAIVTPSAAFTDACSDLGLSDWLKQWGRS